MTVSKYILRIEPTSSPYALAGVFSVLATLSPLTWQPGWQHYSAPAMLVIGLISGLWTVFFYSPQRHRRHITLGENGDWLEGVPHQQVWHIGCASLRLKGCVWLHLRRGQQRRWCFIRQTQCSDTDWRRLSRVILHRQWQSRD
ncbi:hypothetical protein LJ739_00385 [Aestuariibacter halophilus]|uniref:Toxin CptA n=1 Tax=Fluctibacter halophilus TaxID=226011 RepID=A0ABS8G2D6_9ALTE|nr:protein YgfX [Aestuariibacter halophilus]MCC2614695.1 hypothetical protein [Aestuariibacter halophilus]